ncbi:hypothetical protein NST77_02515 [Niallia sp. FSL W8-0177]
MNATFLSKQGIYGVHHADEHHFSFKKGFYGVHQADEHHFSFQTR